jgi:hypothetical protein
MAVLLICTSIFENKFTCILIIAFKVIDEMSDNWSRDDISNVFCIFMFQGLEGNANTLTLGIERGTP